MREDVEMPFGDHLEELRQRIIYALVGLVVASIICGVNYDFLLTALLRPYKRAYEQLIAYKVRARKAEEKPAGASSRYPPIPIPDDSPLAPALRAIEKRLGDLQRRLDAIAPEPPAGPDAPPEALAYAQRFPAPRVIQGGPLTGYITAILLCVICGIILASPWIIYQIWAFVGVGLYPHERRFVYIYGPFSFLLFLGGAATFYFVMLPVALSALMAPTAGIMVDGVPIIDPSFFLNDYFKFVAMMTLIFGVVFQTPLIVLFLAYTGIIPFQTLLRRQRVVILILCIASAVLTPQDPVTMVMMAIPLVGLYEFGLLLAWIALRRKRRREAERAREEEEEEGGGDRGGGPEGPPSPAPPEGPTAAGAALPPEAADRAQAPDEVPPSTEPTGEAEPHPETPLEEAETGYDYPTEDEFDPYREDDLYEYERDYGDYGTGEEDPYGYAEYEAETEGPTGPSTSEPEPPSSAQPPEDAQPAPAPPATGEPAAEPPSTEAPPSGEEPSAGVAPEPEAAPSADGSPSAAEPPPEHPPPSGDEEAPAGDDLPDYEAGIPPEERMK